jgi:spore maturation protein CgeB
LKIVIFGLSITSSWGNGHATTYRALLKALRERGHHIVFFEKNQEWYESNRDLPHPEFCDLRLFEDWNSILSSVRDELEGCHVAVAGSYFPDGISAVQEILDSKAPVKAFYDIDTPITVANLRAGGTDFLHASQVAGFDLYFSFTGGPLLAQLESEFGVRRAVPLYCSVDPQQHYPRKSCKRYQCDLSYMGTYAADRKPKVDRLFTTVAAGLPEMKFLLAGPQYPANLKWPKNVRHIHHLSPHWHPHFYSSSRLTLNLTREAMVASGFSPSVRLFEAAACGATLVSDFWTGLDTFLQTGEEILVAEDSNQVASFLKDMDESQLRTIGKRAQERVLAEQSSTRRAEEFEQHIFAAMARGKSQHLSPPLTTAPGAVCARLTQSVS